MVYIDFWDHCHIVGITDQNDVKQGMTVYPKELESGTKTDILISTFRAALFTTAIRCIQSKLS